MAYRRILASPHVLSLARASVVARLPVGMGGIAIVIYLHEQTGSFGAAGLAAGAFTPSAASSARLRLLAAALPALGLPLIIARRHLFASPAPIEITASA